MKELHALVDYENVQPALEELAKLAPGFTDVWLFHGPHQAKQAQQLAASHERVALVPRSGNGRNALDFHLTFYLGYVAAKHPAAHLVVVANDKGYDPMIAHARLLNFTVKRVGHKAKPPTAAKPAAKKPALAAKAAPAKKAASAKAPAPAKKAATKQPVAKQAAPKQAPAKKAPAQKAPAKKVPSKKVPAKKAALAQAQPKAAPASESKEFTRIKKALGKMGAERPTKRKSFLRHVQAMLGKDSTAEQVDALVHQLEQAKVVRIAGEVVSYA